MKKENCIKREKTEKKKIIVAIRITKKVSKWLKDENLSPTAIFYEGLKDLNCKEL